MKKAEKLRYTREAETEYHEMAAKLTGIKDQVEKMIADDVLRISEPIGKQISQAETQLAAVQERIAQLKHAEDASWQSNKQDLETGWEDLLRSIKSLVTRID